MSNVVRHIAPGLETRLPILGTLLTSTAELSVIGLRGLGRGLRYLGHQYLTGSIHFANLISRHRVGVHATLGTVALCGGITMVGYELGTNVAGIPELIAGNAINDANLAAETSVDTTFLAVGAVTAATGAGLCLSAAITHDMRQSETVRGEIPQGLDLFG